MATPDGKKPKEEEERSSVFTIEDTSSLPVPETKFNGSEGRG